MSQDQIKAREQIERALVFLAGRCDHARNLDRVGFNAFDANTGHSLANSVSVGLPLTDKEYRSALDLLFKYRDTQLVPNGYELPESYSWGEAVGRVSLDGNNTVIIRFSYDPKIVERVRKIQGRRWNPQRKVWTAPVTSLNGIKEHLPAFSIDPQVEQAFSDAKSRPQQKQDQPSPQKPQARVELDGDRLAIYFSYDPKKVTAVKKIAGRRWDPKAKRWTAPVNIGAVSDTVDFAERNGVTLMPEVKELAERLAQEATAKLDLSRASDAQIEVTGLGGDLYPYQGAGVAYARDAKRAIIGDEMGLGKTVQALATAQALDAFPALVICPATLKINWRREIQKWLPGKSVLVISGRANGFDYSAYDVVIVNYGIVTDHQKALEAVGFKAVIADESHYIKNQKAKRSKAVVAIMSRADVRLLLTGTPVVNRPSELINQLKALGRLEELGGWYEFATRYCGAYRGRFGWDLSGATNLDELNEKLRATCYVRRRKEDVLKELPPKTRADVVMELSNLAEYDRAEKNVIEWLAGEAEADQAFLDSISDLPEDEQRKRKAARRNSAKIIARRAEQLTRITALKKLASRGKITPVVDWVKNFLESGEKLILFAHHIEVQKAILAQFPDAAHILGEDSAITRQGSVDRFQYDEDCNLIVCSLKAAGVGLTLTAASNVAFVELGWTPAEHDQAEDRAHRIGQKGNVTCWYFLAEGTIDEEIKDLIEKKRTVVNASTDGGDLDETGVLKGVIDSLLGKA